ncbi:energy-coupling factor transporter transmembrane protein EcfT [Anoxybacillus sp. KU2-6(11)]|uniref:energy-coupling factor transporter transmembrane component T family protein n=1 Tax=Anoxybacillus sp. KU2-6(11) TaxID=1535751 RepID=UPI000A861F11|nr:energy-coupling factor transporter transmembrane component T [Anoxybacillus sp. KU2-6(11)]
MIDAHTSSTQTQRHDVHPLSMLIITFTYIFVVASFHSYAFIEMMPLSLYPITMIVFYRLSVRHIKNVLLASLPFIIVIGGSQLFFINERISFLHWHIEAGWLALATLVVKNTLAILAATVLLLTTPIEQLAGALLSLRIPRFLVVQLLLTYRYIFFIFRGSKTTSSGVHVAGPTPPRHPVICLGITRWALVVANI